MLLAGHEGGDPHLFGWYLGLAIAFTVIVVVVVVVAVILAMAARISRQALDAIAALDEGRANSLPLWDVQKINESAKGILEAAKAARGVLGG
ncbi:MAG TPA: hypothetical protein VM784_08295 [Actinomycetota bacterium]|jgi:hypothetical protein|nr:hypothetical protein [Actinomycetota bacterium]